MTTIFFTLLLPLVWFAFWVVVIGNLLVPRSRPRWWAIPLSVMGPFGALIALAVGRTTSANEEWLPS